MTRSRSTARHARPFRPQWERKERSSSRSGHRLRWCERCRATGFCSSSFPETFRPRPNRHLVLEDLPAGGTTGFGDLGRVWFGSQRGLKVYDRASLDSDAAAQAARLLDALRADVAGHLAYRAVRDQSASSRQSDDRAHRQATDLARVAASRADLLQSLAELGDRLGLQGADTGVRFSSLMAAPPSSQGPTVAADSRSLALPAAADRAETNPGRRGSLPAGRRRGSPGQCRAPPAGPSSKP